jgi:hypothetical protein
MKYPGAHALLPNHSDISPNSGAWSVRSRTLCRRSGDDLPFRRQATRIPRMHRTWKRNATLECVRSRPLELWRHSRAREWRGSVECLASVLGVLSVLLISHMQPRDRGSQSPAPRPRTSQQVRHGRRPHRIERPIVGVIGFARIAEMDLRRGCPLVANLKSRGIELGPILRKGLLQTACRGIGAVMRGREQVVHAESPSLLRNPTPTNP